MLQHEAVFFSLFLFSGIHFCFLLLEALAVVPVRVAVQTLIICCFNFDAAAAAQVTKRKLPLLLSSVNPQCPS